MILDKLHKKEKKANPGNTIRDIWKKYSQNLVKINIVLLNSPKGEIGL